MVGTVSGDQSRNYSYNGNGVLVAETSGDVTTRYAQDLALGLEQVLQIQESGSTTRVVYGGAAVQRGGRGAHVVRR
ncbi:MAG: hypothetical protein OHK0022_44930 [Roseiflexaceae bacterium]